MSLILVLTFSQFPLLLFLKIPTLLFLTLVLTLSQFPLPLLLLIPLPLPLCLVQLPLSLPESASQYPIPQNSHPMQTRAKSGIVQIRLHPSLFLTHTEPKSVKQALQDPNWYSAMQAEFDALISNKTWTLVPLPPGRQAIGCKWIFRIKENPDGSINRYKARLVAIGFHQVQGYDFNETFSPVVKPTTIRLILTLALSHHWKLH